MENASKALIIAASVIVAIILVAMGTNILYKSRDLADTTALDSTEITMFNQKFERFAGKQNGSNVKSLLSFAISNASTNKDEPSKLPSFDGVGSVAGGTSASGDKNIQTYINGISNDIRKNINSTATYDVELEYSANGLISKIIITKK